MIDEYLVERIKEGKGYVAILAGSGSDDKPQGDKPSHIEQIVQGIEFFDIPYGVHIASAHKQPTILDNLITEYNNLEHPLLLVAVAGGTDALSGTASWASAHPVISCPPDGRNESCLTNPPGSSNAYIEKPSNVGRFAAQMFWHLDPTYQRMLQMKNNSKVDCLRGDNQKISQGYLDRLRGK